MSFSETKKLLEEGPFVHRFKCEGKSYKLYKEVKTKNAPWYIHFQWNKRRTRRCLNTNVAKVAEVRAINRLIKPAKAEKWQEIKLTRATGGGSTVGRIIEVYQRRAFIHVVKERTGRNNISMLRKVLSVATGRESPDTLPLSQLTDRTLRNFKENFLDNRLKGVAEKEKDKEIRRARITGNSMMGQAKGIFSRALLQIYKDERIEIPESVQSFVDEPGFKKVKIEYSPPSKAIIDETFRQIAKMKDTDPNLFKAFWCAVGCGLRKSEILKADWSSFQEHGDMVWFLSEELGKDGMPIKVPVVSDAWNQLAPLRDISGPILVGGYREINKHVWDRIGQWMSGIGWRTEKRIHELRAWIGSKIAEEHGMTMASLFLRHKDVRTTQKSYSRYLEVRNIDVKIG